MSPALSKTVTQILQYFSFLERKKQEFLKIYAAWAQYNTLDRKKPNEILISSLSNIKFECKKTAGQLEI